MGTKVTIELDDEEVEQLRDGWADIPANYRSISNKVARKAAQALPPPPPVIEWGQVYRDSWADLRVVLRVSDHTVHTVLLTNPQVQDRDRVADWPRRDVEADITRGRWTLIGEVPR
jgi:hypothetical protein